MKRKLLSLLMALVAVAPFTYVKADTTILEAEDGWTKVTELSDVDNYFYVIADHSQDLMLGMATGNYQTNQYKTLFYQTSADPVSDFSKLFTLTNNGGYYHLCNVKYDGLMLQTEWDKAWYYRTHDQPNPCEWTRITPTYENGYWTIKNGRYPESGYLGPWDNTVVTDAEVALNKIGEAVGHFQIYAINKSDYAALLLEEASSQTPKDASILLTNPTFELGTGRGWTFTGSAGNRQTSEGTYEIWKGNAYTLLQTVSVLPNGKYKLTAQMIAGNDKTSPNLYAATKYGEAQAPVQVTNSIPNYSDGSNNLKNDNTLGLLEVGVIVTDGTLTFGVKEDASQDSWILVDNFQLKYFGTTLINDAVALPDGGAMTAGTWYAVTIPADGDYNVTATTVNDIVYTTDETLLTEEANTSVTATFSSENPQQLTAGTYYVKSSSTQTLSIVADVNTYEIGTPTISPSDNAYIQHLNTVTFTFDNAVSTDPEATFALVNEKKAILGGAATAEGTLSINGNVVTATFEGIEIAFESEYTVTLPSDAVKYYGEDGESYNATQTITLKTPAIYDGTYYLYNTYTENYISRGGSWATQAKMENFGLAVYLKTSADGTTTIQFFDSEQYLGDDGFCYTDCTEGRVRHYKVSSTTDGYKFLNTNNSNESTKNYLAVWGGVAVGDGREGDNLDGTSNVWALQTYSEYMAQVATYEDGLAAAAAGSAGISATTKEALEEELLENYGTQTINITGAEGEKYQQYPAQQEKVNPLSYHAETLTVTPGLYKVSVDAFQRAAWNERVEAAGGARGNVYLYANDKKVQLKSIMEHPADAAYTQGSNPDYADKSGKHYPNSKDAAMAALQTYDYTNEIYVYVPDNGDGTGTLTFGMENPSRIANAGTWIVYRNYTVTYYAASASAEDVAALNNAIAACEVPTFGFADGEAAPYNNIEAIETLENAKALAEETKPAQDAVLDATAAVEAIEWTLNDGEVNAIYDGSFEYPYSQDGNVQPIAWQGTSGHDNATDVRYMWNVSANAGLAATSTSKALFTKFGAFYGNEEGYTMPLKENTIYELTFVYGGWSDCQRDGYVTMTGPNDESITLTATRLPLEAVTGHQDASKWKTYTARFKTTSAGNYVLGLRKDRESESKQSQYVYGDFKLFTAKEETIDFAISEAGWATLILPFEATKPGRLTLYSDVAENGDYLTLTEAGDVIEANTPYIVSGAKGEYPLTGISFITATTVTKGNLTGVFADTEIASGYVLQNGTEGVGFYAVVDAINVTPYRVYVNLPAGVNTRFLLPGDETAIDATAAEDAIVDVYHIGGTLVKSGVKAADALNGLPKGIYVVGGKKVMK